MKRIISLLIITLIVLMTISGTGSLAFADENYSDEYYRASSRTGNLSEQERNSLDEDCIGFIKTYKIDMVLLTVDAEEKGITDLKTSADEYYEDCGFGYGKSKDGIMATYDVSENKVHYTFYGKAVNLIPQKYIEFAADGAVKKLEKYGEFGVLYSAMGYMRDYFEEHGTEPIKDSGKKENTDSGETSGNDNNNADSERNLPEWYPDDVSGFKFFSDANAPRVVDNADIFSDEEEKNIAELIKKSSAESGKDIVVFTDVSTYGFDRKIYAADFYDFNGYGFGKDREGACLMICMDPDDRGWWTCCTGPDTKELYTEPIAQSVDDELYNYMVDGDYAAGVSDWIKNMKTLFIKGIPFAPEWYPDRGSGSFNRINDSSAPRVYDSAEVLTEEQKNELESRISEMSGKFGYDIVIHISDTSYNMENDEYADKFYEYNGYGFGNKYDGILTVLFTSSDDASVRAYGKLGEEISNVNISRLQNQCETEDKYEAAMKFLDNIEHMQKTGRVPRSKGTWIFGMIVALIIGAIVALTDYVKARAGMKTPHILYDANNYIVRESLNIRAVMDKYLRSDVSEVYDPVTDDDDSSSSGGSTFSSSYKGSSGATHSGSGRNF